jgi:hypothetical protein
MKAFRHCILVDLCQTIGTWDLMAAAEGPGDPCKRIQIRVASKTNFRENDLVIGNEVRCRYVFAQHSQFMKFSLSLRLRRLLLSSCSEEPPPPTVVLSQLSANADRRISASTAAVQSKWISHQVPREMGAASPVPTAAPTKVAKGDYPYGIPVPGKPHLVESPFSPGKYVDVEGFPPGTEVKDPYTDKIFLVP